MPHLSSGKVANIAIKKSNQVSGSASLLQPVLTLSQNRNSGGRLSTKELGNNANYGTAQQDRKSEISVTNFDSKEVPASATVERRRTGTAPMPRPMIA